MSSLDEPSYYSSSFFYVSPFETASDLIRAALRILRDEDNVAAIIDDSVMSKIYRSRGSGAPGPLDPPVPRTPPGILKRFIRRFILGLPIIGAGSIVHMLLSLPFLGPVQWIARYRGNRRRGNSRDMAALIVVLLLVVGAARLVLDYPSSEIGI